MKSNYTECRIVYKAYIVWWSYYVYCIASDGWRKTMNTKNYRNESHDFKAAQ